MMRVGRRPTTAEVSLPVARVAGAMPHLCTLLFKPSWGDWAPLLAANKGLLLAAALVLVALPAGKPIQARGLHTQPHSGRWPRAVSRFPALSRPG